MRCVEKNIAAVSVAHPNAIVVASEFDDVIDLAIGHKHRAHPVMDQSVSDFHRISPGYWSDADLSAVDFGGASGVLKRPKEAAAGADPVLKVRVCRLQVIVPGGYGFRF